MENIIIQGDSLQVLKKIPKESVNLILTSPPYNVGIDYGDYKDNKEFNKYIEWLLEVFKKCIKVLSPGGHLLIQVANTGKQPYRPVSHSLGYFLSKEKDIEFRGEIVWNKNNETAKTAWGSWMSANKPSIRDRHEYLLVFRKPGKRKGKFTGSKAEFMKLTESIWSVAPARRNGHPAPFPEKLVENVLTLYTFENELVLDPFIGSGTTAVSCLKLNRKFIGIELNEDYVELANKRIKSYLEQTKLI